MNKRSLILFCLLLVGGGLAWLVINRYSERAVHHPAFSDKELAKAAARLYPKAPTQPTVVAEAPIAPSRAVRLAIGWLGLSDEIQNLQVGDLLTAELTGAKGLELVDRQSLSRVLRELELSLSGLVRANEAVRAGKLLKADWFLLGTATSLNGTNSVVVRLVDARTGIMRDGAVFACEAPGIQMAQELAGFVRRCRQDAAQPRPRLYLAIGALEDLSVNSRQAAFPTQLRGYLTAAYQHGEVTLLEREYVNTLLHEVHLDLAGLTEEGATNAPVPMQSAFWLAWGSYQSYETSDLQVELELSIRRMLGRSKQVRLRGRPDAVLLGKVKEAIDSAMKDKHLVAVPTRSDEISAQMRMGKDLAQFGPHGLVWGASINRTRPADLEAERRNIEEAIRAFETVLLLNPGHREAKLCLAACLRNYAIGRIAEARDYCRQVIESPIQDAWTGTAQAALLETFRSDDPAARARWFEAVAQQNTNSPAGAFYRQAAETARADELVGAGDGARAQKVAEPRLFEAMKTWNKDLRSGGQIVDFHNTGLGGFAESFGTNGAAAANRLVELLPQLQRATPDLAPHMLAGVVSYQVNTNSQVIAQFERALEEQVKHPTNIFKSDYYFQLLSGPVYHWCTDRKLYALGAKVIEARLSAAPRGSTGKLEPEKMMSLAFARMAAGRWQEALDVFLCYSNRPLAMGNSGLWGRAFTVVLTGKEAAFCRQKLGLPSVSDPREFTLDKPCLCLHTPSAFCVDADALWIGIGGRLLQLDMALHTNLDLRLPVEASVPINFLSVTPSNIWISTGGDGLVEFDKGTRQFRRLTAADGLLMDDVGQVHPAGDALWIAYASRTVGGLGRLDLRTRKVTSFTPSLFPSSAGNDPTETQGRGVAGAPPRKPIHALVPGRAGEVWFVEGGQLRRFRGADSVWETFPEAGGCQCLMLTADRLFTGHSGIPWDENLNGRLGVGILDFGDGKWRQLPAQGGLPHEMVTAVALDGQDLWLGGMGYIARVAPDLNQVRRYAYVPTRSVDHIQIAGGCLWAQFDKHLHKVMLAASH